MRHVLCDDPQPAEGNLPSPAGQGRDGSRCDARSRRPESNSVNSNSNRLSRFALKFAPPRLIGRQPSAQGLVVVLRLFRLATRRSTACG